MSLRLAFMGTPEFSVPTLEALIAAGHEVAAVYSQPPRPAGRGMAERRSPAQLRAEADGIVVRTPASLRDSKAQEEFIALQVDAAVVVAYGLLLPTTVLAAPRLGCFNVHASLLPRWRGAAPVQRAIMAGDAETGVCIMRMEEGLDTGPVCGREAMLIRPEDTAGYLHDRLAEMGARLMVSALERANSGTMKCVVQSSEGVTYARKIDKAEARIDFSRSADAVRNQIHGLSPFPGAWFVLEDMRIRVLACEAVGGAGVPGTVLDDQLTIACGSDAVKVLTLQREGKGAMDAAAFLRGRSVAAGTKLA